MIYTITLNPSLDYVMTVEDLNWGAMNRSTDECIYPGGKGINVSMVLSELGVDNTALGFVAGFTGEHMTHMLNDKNINNRFIHVAQGTTRINVKLRSVQTVVCDEPVDECDADWEVKHAVLETEINGRGPVISEDELEQLLDIIRGFHQEDILVISGSVPPSVSQSIYADMLKICNENHVKVIVDASGALLWNVLEYQPYMIKPNHHELGDIFNREITTRDEVIFYARELQNRGASNVLVSMGGAGAILVAEDGEVYEEAAPSGVVVNTVGAGDSMVAGFVYGLFGDDSDNSNFRYALHMGICAGSATAFSAGLASKQSIKALLDTISIEGITDIREEDTL